MRRIFTILWVMAGALSLRLGIDFTRGRRETVGEAGTLDLGSHRVGGEDAIAPYEDTAALLAREFPERVRAVRIDGAGHALLPEASARIRSEVLDFLKK